LINCQPECPLYMAKAPRTEHRQRSIGELQEPEWAAWPRSTWFEPCAFCEVYESSTGMMAHRRRMLACSSMRQALEKRILPTLVARNLFQRAEFALREGQRYKSRQAMARQFYCYLI